MIAISTTTLLLATLALASPAQDEAPAKSPILVLLEADRDQSKSRAADASLSAEQRAALAARAERMTKVLDQPDEYRAQILVGEILEEAGAKKLSQTGWRVDHEYFYPASTVKLFGVVAALERLNDVRSNVTARANENTPLGFQPLRRNATLQADDPDNLEGGKITLAHAIREVLLVSDNDSFNRLYDFAGQDWINQRMWRAGLSSVRVAHRLSVGFSVPENRRTPSIELRLPEGPVLLEPRVGTEDLGLSGVQGVFVGTKHLQAGEKVNGPMSFFYKNRATLRDLQAVVARIVRPDIALEGQPFDLTDAQRQTIVGLMRAYPGDSSNPRYDRAKFPDDYAKFFLPGLLRVLPKDKLQLCSKMGLAYGFATDTAYIADTQSGRAFFLTATIYANSDGVVDDDQYDYETFGLPWLADVAEIVARDVFARAK